MFLVKLLVIMTIIQISFARSYFHHLPYHYSKNSGSIDQHENNDAKTEDEPHSIDDINEMQQIDGQNMIQHDQEEINREDEQMQDEISQMNENQEYGITVEQNENQEEEAENQESNAMDHNQQMNNDQIPDKQENEEAENEQEIVPNQQSYSYVRRSRNRYY